ncbi:hypothetical protein KI387_009791, partial [Taxus chinensis]
VSREQSNITHYRCGSTTTKLGQGFYIACTVGAHFDLVVSLAPSLQSSPMLLEVVLPFPQCSLDLRYASYNASAQDVRDCMGQSAKVQGTQDSTGKAPRHCRTHSKMP